MFLVCRQHPEHDLLVCPCLFTYLSAFAVTLQGFVLGQYGLLYALAHEEQISRLFVLNTPLALTSKLRPELAAYKSPIPFMRPGNVSGCSSSSSSSSSWCSYSVCSCSRDLSHCAAAGQSCTTYRWRFDLISVSVPIASCRNAIQHTSVSQEYLLVRSGRSLMSPVYVHC
jgi:hypothetical protein